MLVLAASQSDGVALENGKLQHGLLTYTLLTEGLAGGLADWRPKDGQVTVTEWLTFAVNRVPHLADEIRAGRFADRGLRGVVSTKAGERVTQIPVLFDFRKNSASDAILIGKPR